MIADDFAEVSKIVEVWATQKKYKTSGKEQLKRLKDKKTKLMLDEWLDRN